MKIQVDITDYSLVEAIQDELIIGDAFAFLNAKAFKKPQLLWARQLFHAQSYTLPLLGHGSLDLPGCNVRRLQLPKLRVQSITSDKSLYKKEDPVHLLLIDMTGRSNVVSVCSNGVETARYPVEFSSRGIATLVLRGLTTGDYSVCYVDDDSQACEFTVAEYTLSPLTATIEQKRVENGRITVWLKVESYGLPVEGDLKVTLTRGLVPVSTKTERLAGGRTTSVHQMEGDGPFALNLILADDPAKTATLPIVGSRASERSQTAFSLLGKEVTGSLLPGLEARSVRGVYLQEGARVTTPFTLERVDTRTARLTSRCEASELCIIAYDPTFPTARPDAVDPEQAEPPDRIDPDYRRGEELFKKGYYSDALGLFSASRARLPHPHPFYAYFEACCYARMGQRAAALHALRRAIEDGWKDFEHMANDEDLASLRGEAGFQQILSRGYSETRYGLLHPGQTVEIEVHSPASILAIGCYADGKPWEGWAATIAPAEVSAEVEVARPVVPGEEVELEVRTGAPASVYLIVKDARLLSTDTPQSRLAGRIKSFVEEAGRLLTTGTPKNRLIKAVEGSRRKFLPPPMPMAMPMPAGMTRSSAGALDTLVGAPSALYSAASESAPQDHTATGSQAIISEAPEVVYAGLVEATDGSVRVRVMLGASFTDYVVEAFAFTYNDYAYSETRFRAERDPFVSLQLPTFVHELDTAVGRFIAGSSSGVMKLKLLEDGVERSFAVDGSEVSSGQSLEASRVEATFLVKPADYQLYIEDANGVMDVAVKRVNAPGKTQVPVKSLKLVENGSKITLSDYADAVGLRVLPGLDKPFKALVNATSDYGHACCEQTAAILLAACAMYSMATDSNERERAESIILAGIAREQKMWLRGQGFKIYPESPDQPNEYYGRKAAIYLRNLELIRKSASRRLQKAIDEGLEMSADACAAYKIAWPVTEPRTCEEGYAAVRFSTHARARERALELARLRASKPDAADPSGYLHGRVIQRAECGYAAATLLRAGGTPERKQALELTNLITADLGEEGRLYSTVDSVAAIALMSELQEADLVGTAGRVAINGLECELKEALTRADISSLEVLEGTALVEVHRMVEMDWSRFASTAQASVTLEQNGRTQHSFTTAETLELKVKLLDGYKAGDLVWVCLPEALSRLMGGGQVKLFSVDFKGSQEVSIPLVTTSVTVNRDGRPASQHFCVCVRNMFEEERAGNPGPIEVSVTGAKTGGWLSSLKRLFQ